jgi:transaldolase
VLAHEIHSQLFTSERFKVLELAGARPQRLLWASTGVKNPDYADTMYVTGLVAANTVNTMPEPTIEAFADHGEISGRDHCPRTTGPPTSSSTLWPAWGSTMPR